MFGKLKRFLCFLDDLAEVLVFHVFFSKANWKKTTGLILLASLALTQGTWLKPARPARPATRPVVAVSAEALARTGYDALLKGKTREAIRNLSLAVARDPGKPLYLQRLGLAYLEANQNEQARNALERSFSLSRSRTTLFYLGCVYQNLKLNEVAIGLFNQVKSAGSKEARMVEGALGYEPVAEAKIGECYLRQGEHGRAIESLSRTVAQYPNYPHSYFYLGVAYWDQGNPDLGVEQFFKVIELYPQESAAYYNVACYYSIKGIPDLALVWLEKAFRAGFAQMKHMRTDHDLDNIRGLPQYETLVAKYKKVLSHED